MRRQITTTANSSHHFLLGSLQTKAKAQEPKLSRSSLVLKFKLTSELVASVRALDRLGGAAPGHSQPRDARQTTGSLASADITRSHRNQSHGFPQKGPAETQQQVSGARLMELLRLECRYKLTEVSDVTFNELRVSGRPSAPSGGPSSSGGDTLERRRRSSNQWRHFELTSADINVESSPRRATDLKLFKSHTNQVMQSNCPARRRDLMLLLQPKRSSSKRSACRLGLLALQREDPAILADESDSSADPTHEPLQLMNSQSPPELPIGSTLSVNCSTLGALSWSPLASSVSSSVSTSPSWSTFARGRSVSTATDNELQAPHQQRSYCDDQEARRRLLISGKHPWPSSGPLDQVVANQRSRSSSLLQQQPNNRRDHVAYVTLDPTTTNTIASSAQANSKKRQQQQQSHDSNLLDDKLSLPPEFAAADSSNFGSQQQDQLHNNNEQTDDSSDWLAPPLLEWFINDQEVSSRSLSVLLSLSCELPLVWLNNKPPDLLPGD